jgi:ATP-dependent Clp protease ATP-binding subunit ClpA
VPFLPLSEEAVRGIIDKFINALNQRLSVHCVTVSLDASAYEPLMEKGYSRPFGARAMERTIEEAIARPISEYLLSRKQEEEISFLVREEGGAINLQQKRQKVALPPTAT